MKWNGREFVGIETIFTLYEDRLGEPDGWMEHRQEDIEQLELPASHIDGEDECKEWKITQNL